MIRLGLDLHGVIDAAPEFFSLLSKQMTEKGHEVYIITGREDTPLLTKELIKTGMISEPSVDPAGTYPTITRRFFNRILSITSYQKDLGVPVSYLDDRKSQPMMDPKIWNPTKAVLCAAAGIDIMIDDSSLYEPFFRDIRTQYIIYSASIMEWLNLMFYHGG